MEPPQSFPILSVQSGVRVEETRFQWRIRNFHVVLLHDSLVEASGIEFSAGETIWVGSKWAVQLSSVVMDGRKWAGLFFAMREQPALRSEFLFAQCAFSIQNGEGITIFNQGTIIKDMYELESRSNGWGIPQIFEMDADEWKDETIDIPVNFKLYSPTIITPSSVEGAVEKFLEKFSDTLMEDLVNARPWTDMQIISNSQTTFSTKMNILRTNKTEEVLRILYMNSCKTLRVILNYINTGQLRGEWRDSDVLVELTQAAAKYQLPELLNFLDMVIGRVCTLDNVGALVMLAKRLCLKTAEEDLLDFVRNKGTDSPESFLQILKSVSTPMAEEVLVEGRELYLASGEKNVGSNCQGGNPIAAGGKHSEMEGNGGSNHDPPGKRIKRI